MSSKQQIRQQIIQYFKSVGSGENILQAIKQALFLNEKFNPLLIFQLISQGKQKIMKDDWRKYLNRRNINFVDEEIKYFFRINHFHEEITLNQFLQAMIPYNADVIRQFKTKYLQSLQIEEMGPQVQFIFSQLMNNWMKFIKKLLKIRIELSRKVTRKQIQHLVKQDLVLYSKPREARKFHQSFHQSKFSLTFHELRKFLQLWVSSKELLHQFCLLNVKRHIKCDNPFEKIVYSKKKSKQRSLSTSRSVSKRKQISEPHPRTISTDKKKTQKEQEKQYQYDNSKYDEYKKQLKDALNKEIGDTENIDDKKKKYGKEQSGNKEQKKNYFLKNYQKDQSSLWEGFQNQVVQKSVKDVPTYTKNKNQNQSIDSQLKKYRKDSPGQIIVKILEEIVTKEEKLQKLRKQLAKCNDFNLINLFKLVDHKNKGYINAEDISQFCQDQNSCNQNLVKFFGRDHDKLRLQQFSLIFRPLSKQLNQNLDKRPQHKIPNPFKRQTSLLILQIIKLSSNMHVNLQNYKRKIKQEGISSKSLFQYIDLDNCGFITSQNMKQLLQQNNINCQAKELKCLMKLFNKRVDQKIYTREFSNFIDF